VRFVTTIATKWEVPQSDIGVVGLVPTAVTIHSLLSLACFDLNRESLADTDSLTGNGPDVVAFCFGTNGRLEHLMEDLALMGGHVLLQLAEVREVSAKATKEARIKAIHESLADAHGKHLLIDEKARGGEDLSVMIKHRR
jgi:hypothetical protein